MDSPVRKALKRNDYLRHKLFRKIKRRQRNKIELDSKIAEKELKRRLRRPKFDGGKDGISDDEYYRIMENVANLNYKSWGFDNPEDALVSALNDNTYDYRGFYNEFANSDANAKTHWTDKYKTVYHPTFSEESKYSGNVSDYNPTGMRGGTWSKLRPVYRLSKDQMANNWDVNKTKEYLQREGVDVKTPYDPYMLLERTYKDGTKLYFDEEGQLLNPTTLGLIGDAASYSLHTPTPFADWKWQNTESPELNAHLRLAQYMLNASARDFDNVALGTMGAGIIIPAALTLGLAQLGKFAIDATSGYLFDKAYRLANNRTFAETLYDRYSIPKPIGEFMNPGFFLRGSTKKLYNIIKDRAVGRGFNYRDSYNNINEYLKSMQDVKRNAIDRQSHYFVKPSLEEKNAFGYRYNKYAENITANLDLYNYVNKLLTDDKTYYRIANLFEHNPEYAIHCLQNNILNPLSQDAVNGFIERQLTSIRGVTAENTKDAIRNLTETRLGERLSGGDALNTNGGLYTSNNPTVADRFKNPDGGDKAGNGYVGILREDYTNDPTATVELLLKKLRSRIQLERNSSPFAGTGYLLPKDDNVIAYEDAYVGRADLGTGGHERGYLPVKKRPVNIKHITEYKNLVDLHGRFALDVKADVLPNLFLHRLLNRYDDYIKYARALLKGKRVKDFDKASRIAKEFDENTTTRANKARDIISKRVDAIYRINKSIGRLLEFSQGYLVLPLGLSIMINDAAKRGSDNVVDDALLRNIINEYGQLNYQLYDQYDNKDELYRALRRLSNGGLYNIYTGEPYKHNSGKDIHIKPSRRGTFTAAAKKHGMSVQAYARKVLKAPKGKYSSAMRKKANFARNASRWNK